MDISTYIVLCPTCLNPAMNQLVHGVPLKPSAAQSLQTKDTFSYWISVHVSTAWNVFHRWIISYCLLGSFHVCRYYTRTRISLGFFQTACWDHLSTHLRKTRKTRKTQCSPFWWSCYSCRFNLLFHCNQIFEVGFWQPFFFQLKFTFFNFNSLPHRLWLFSPWFSLHLPLYTGSGETFLKIP